MASASLKPSWSRQEIKLPSHSNKSIFTIKGNYKITKVLGCGAQGSVVAAYDETAKQFNAIKRIARPLENNHRAKYTYREIAMLSACEHTNIVRLKDLFSGSEDSNTNTPSPLLEIYLVMDLMDSDMKQLINSHGMKDLDTERLSFLMYQLFCGIRNLHSVGIIHRDLKPANILLNSDCTLRIADFGLARKLDEDKDELKLLSTPGVGTRYYKAPEILLGLNYDEKIDIWSIGCIFAELLYGQVLFKGEDDRDQFERITKVLGKPDKEFIKKAEPGVGSFVEALRLKPLRKSQKSALFAQIFPDNFFPPDSEDLRLAPNYARSLLCQLLCMSPEDRISVDDALNHTYIIPWVQGYEEETFNCKKPDVAFLDRTENRRKENLQAEDYKLLILAQIDKFK